MITYFWFELNLNFLLDTFAHKGKRKQLVEILVQKGITNKKVLNAIGTIPRHLFMDSGFVDHAYIDKAFPIGADQTISQPFTVAKQTELLNLEKGSKILEIGTGSGFQTAVLIEMGMHVFSIERQNELFKKKNISIYWNKVYEPDYLKFDKYLMASSSSILSISLGLKVLFKVCLAKLFIPRAF